MIFNNKIKQLIIWTLGITIVVMLLMRINVLPSLGNIFSRKAILIDNTNILIREIRPLAQLVTVAAHEEIVLDSIKYHEPGLANKFLRLTTPLPVSLQYDELVLIVRGKVMAGIDLEQLRLADVSVSKDSVSITLPAATVLDVIMNPSDVETFSEKGEWEAEEVTILKESARTILRQRALKQGLLQKANLQATLILKNFLQAAGFKKIQVVVREL